MEAIIADLVQRFERGGLTRRELIGTLSLLIAGGATPVAHAAQGGPLPSMGIDHVSILVADLQRAATFYKDVLGLSPLSEDKANQILRLGTKRTLVSLRREGGASGVVDHFAIAVGNFNKEAVTQQLRQHGLTPQENVQYGFHVKDPDGMIVQVV